MSKMSNKASDLSPLKAHLGYWLRAVSNQVSHAFARKLEARGVSVAEWVMMRELYETDGLAPSHLAMELGMTKGAITKLADRLIEKSLITRHIRTDDRRAQTLALTPTGRKLVPALAALADENDAAFFGHLSAAEQTRLRAMLQAIVQHHGFKNIPVD